MGPYLSVIGGWIGRVSLGSNQPENASHTHIITHNDKATIKQSVCIHLQCQAYTGIANCKLLYQTPQW